MPPSVHKVRFELSDPEQEAHDEWYNAHSKICRMRGRDYIFSTTGIGTKIVVRCQKCGEEKDISDYGSW